MPFLGTIINFFAVLMFGIIGSLLKKGIPKRISDAIMHGMAICVVYIGIDGVLEKAPDVPEGSFLSAGLVKVLIMILSMGIGTLIGELCDFDKLVTCLGNKLEERFDKNKDNTSRGNFAKGFVSCSLLFCVGAMTINGALADAFGKPDILLAKSVIDSFSVFVMSSTLGIGCAFAAFFLLIYQGLISFLGLFLAEVLSLAVMTYMSVTGSLIIILIGTNVLGVTKVKTANMVPAMFMPILLEPLFMFILG